MPLQTSSEPPVFATDEDALAAATEAYAAYLSVVDRVLEAGGKGAEQLASVATGDALAAEIEAASEYGGHGYRSKGRSQFDSVKLQSVDVQDDGTFEMTAYLCADATGVDVIDSAGVSIVPANRADRFPLQVGFQSSNLVKGPLRVSTSESWSGQNFC
jgi:hypothetical protein